MANVLLPCQDEATLLHMQSILWKAYHITIVFGSVPREFRSSLCGETKSTTAVTPASSSTNLIYFIRISTQVYLEMKDFIVLGEKVLEILGRISS